MIHITVAPLTILLSWRISRETLRGRSFESTTPFTKLKYLGNYKQIMKHVTTNKKNGTIGDTVWFYVLNSPALHQSHQR